MISGDERQLLELLPGPLVAVGAGGSILYANQSACVLLDYDDPSELIGQRLSVLIPPRIQPQYKEGFSRYRRTGHSRLLGKRIRISALAKHGDEISLELCIRMFRRPDGTDLIIGALALADSSEDYIDLSVTSLESNLEERAYKLV